jgi:uncharacterized protein YbjT (DUF2867 family)
MFATAVVVDVANSPSYEDQAAMGFFQTAGRNLTAAEVGAGVRHHVVLSIVGSDRSPEIGYFRAKVVQEELIKGSGIPYTIIRSTQFMEFSEALPMRARRTVASTSRPACFSRSQQMTSQPLWRTPHWRHLATA